MLHGFRTALALAFALVFATVSQLPAVSAQTQPDELDALEARVQQLHRAGKYAGAHLCVATLRLLEGPVPRRCLSRRFVPVSL